MGHLIRLEFIKYNVWNFFLAGLLLNFSFALILVLFIISISPGDMRSIYPSYPDYPFFTAFITTFIHLLIIVMSAYLQRHLIVSEFKKDTISVLFSTPVPRSKLLWAKLLLIKALLLVFSIGSFFFSLGALALFNYQLETITVPLRESISWTDALRIFVMFFIVILISFSTLFFVRLRNGGKMMMLYSGMLAAILFLPLNAPNSAGILAHTPVAILLFLLAGILGIFFLISQAKRKN
ncbi:ABC transporter permease [Jeotgalibacillus sp. R-1-5s-1]|uniref:ABC transporter permease n=1 Tax=Jeotgalibacillus sp. R-1-5s-1 TaxID=2555897 RepID=UPI00106A49D6|nr:ABC transporter permease [Jeotgalibacillus sp. R-1-5s-1]TFD99530.1 hypothetical protein E2491_07395 [Jeotgalibacillus sp. R-1-5s-1]